MNSWDYHTTLLLIIFFNSLFFSCYFCCSFTRNYHLNNYTLPVLLLFSSYMATAQVLQLKNNLLKALHHQCNAPNWTRGHREPEPESELRFLSVLHHREPEPWAELHLLSESFFESVASELLFLLPRLCCPLFLCTVLKTCICLFCLKQQCSLI